MEGVCDTAEVGQIYVLVVPEHGGGGVAHELQLVLVRGLHPLEQRGEGMAAAVGRVGVALDPVYLYDGVIYPGGGEGGVEGRPVVLWRDGPSVPAGEHGAAGAAAHGGIHKGLDLWGHGDGPVCACVGFGAAGEGSLGPVIIFNAQGQQLGGPKAQVALAQDRIHAVQAHQRPELIHRLQGQARLAYPGLAADDDIGGQVQVVRHGVAGNAELVDQAAEGLHVLLGAAAQVVIEAVLDIVDVDIPHFHGPDGAQVLQGRPVAVHGGRAPLVVGSHRS